MRNYNMPRGEAHHRAKLNAVIVRACRMAYNNTTPGSRALCIRQLALQHNTSYSTMWEVVNYQSWRHVR